MYQKINDQKIFAVARHLRQNYVFKKVTKYLEEEKIYHIPLKGVVIRKLYREP